MVRPQKWAAAPAPHPEWRRMRTRARRGSPSVRRAEPLNRAQLPGPTAGPSRPRRRLDGCHGDRGRCAGRAGCAGASAQARAATPGSAPRSCEDPAWTSRDPGPERGLTRLPSPSALGRRAGRSEAAPGERLCFPWALRSLRRGEPGRCRRAEGQAERGFWRSQDTCEHGAGVGGGPGKREACGGRGRL